MRPRAGAADEPQQFLLAVFERQPVHIRPFEMEKIEDEIDEPAARGAAERILQRLKARPPVGQDDRHFAVEERFARSQFPDGARNLRASVQLFHYG